MLTLVTKYWQPGKSEKSFYAEGATCAKALQSQGQENESLSVNSSCPECDMGVVSRPRLKG